MSIIAIEDVAHVCYRAPALEKMHAFLSDFGFVEAAADGEALYMRGFGQPPFLHMTERGEAGFAGFAFRAAGRSDLDTLAAAEGVRVEPLTAPGGGEMVRLYDPDGFRIDVVAGQATAPPLPFDHSPWNSAQTKSRVRQTKRVPAGASHVMRLGHIVLRVRDFRLSEQWYKDRFGFLTSDEITTPDGGVLGAFLRCDRGDVPTDHHTLALVHSPDGAAFDHAAFEVNDLDDLMAGHEHLVVRGYQADWGVGRHVLGSQIFDYWRDPWGNNLEHWTDGDLLTAEDGSRLASVGEAMDVQWGPRASFSI
ncbi:VOC family protein [Rhizorhabdus sp.]|uniref:VOC family protein n=1 Tax=Rhizorhabdus sp. TaxID=1968843 RepID=UPI00198D6A28|nr:VOC family protein [Rhizorhabdus sp.]MBD3759332.1 VOC family protein [Rhizorhabdus sp.]